MLKENTVYSELNRFPSGLVKDHLIPSNRTHSMQFRKLKETLLRGKSYVSQSKIAVTNES